ncbi:hypothetical protein K502DRAFT_325933 [Neoconidiobolus thromboides FSU 785]|nr:hypothetical protein K502DRAFT_325933 [Neoconidiobolus thromboides FSU 785]
MELVIELLPIIFKLFNKAQKENNVKIMKYSLELIHRITAHKKDIENINLEFGVEISQLIQILLIALKMDELNEIGLNIALLIVSIPGFPIKTIIFSVTALISKLSSIFSKSTNVYKNLNSPWTQIKALRIINVAVSNNLSLDKIFLPLVIDCFINASNNMRGGSGN